MEDHLHNATFFASSAFAAPTDAVSSAVSPIPRKRESARYEAPVNDAVEELFVARQATPKGAPVPNGLPAPNGMRDSEFSVTDKPLHSDAFAASEPTLPVSPLMHAPLDGHHAPSAHHASVSPKAQEPWRERILLVEDEADIRNLLLHTLKSWGYAVQIAGTGEDALDLWRTSEPHQRAELILTDIQMPGINGLELLRQVRSDSPDMPVIVMTAFSSNQALTRALRLHANDFVAKPIEIPELQTALDRALRARRHREELDNERTRAARLQAVLETATAVNHEINNPLASISASAQLLRYHIDKHSLRTPSTQPGGQNLPNDEMDVEAVNRLLDVILEQCDRIADFNRKLSGVVNPVTRSSGGHRMLDVDGSR